MAAVKHLFLSRSLRKGLPEYNGARTFQAEPTGDSSLRLAFKNHVGTHFDFPCHFLPNGKSLSDYPAEWFIFKRPVCLSIPCAEGRYLTADDLARPAIAPDADLLLIKTGYGAFYHEDKYWNDNPGLDVSAAEFLKSRHPSIRCLGVDFLSLNAYHDKAPGRAAHRAFLSPPEILLIEDMDLAALDDPDARLLSIVAAPLLVEEADGVPCTVIAEIGGGKG